MASSTAKIPRSILPSRPISESLPISQKDPNDQGLRRRLSTLSLKVQPISSAATSWVFTRSKSMSFVGEYAGGSIKSWWAWGWAWIASRKPSFAADLEMNEEESRVLGYRGKGSWGHVFCKVRSEFRKLLGSDHLPMTRSFR